MSIFKKICARTERRKFRVRNRLARTQSLFRAVVFKSNKHLYVTMFDNVNKKSLFSVSSMSSEFKNKSNSVNKDLAQEIGAKFAQHSLQNGIDKIVFDRGSYLYHGRVAALADGMRSAGLNF